MFTINNMPKQLSPAVVSMLAKVETATIGHFLYDAFVGRSLASMQGECRIAGTAVTLQIAHADSTMLHYLTKMVRPGDVVLIDRCGDERYACWGGGISLGMKLAGITAGVVDGPITDLSEIRKLGLPMWATGLSPITTRLLGEFGAINVPVTIGGKIVNPGDAVIADESGIVVLPTHEAEAIGRKAIAMQQEELEILAKIERGQSLSDMSGATAIVEEAMKKAQLGLAEQH